jgi:hypothetical protein
MEIYQSDAGLLQAEWLAVVREGRSYVLPSFLYRTYEVVPSRLSHLGLQIVDRPWVGIGPAKAEMVVEDLHLPYDRDVLEGMDHGIPTASELPAVVPGRYPLERWVFAAEHPQGLLSTAASAGPGRGANHAGPIPARGAGQPGSAFRPDPGLRPGVRVPAGLPGLATCCTWLGVVTAISGPGGGAQLESPSCPPHYDAGPEPPRMSRPAVSRGEKGKPR